MAPTGPSEGTTVGTPQVLEKDQKLSLIDQMSQVPKFSGNGPYYSLGMFIKDFEEWADFFQWEEKDKFFILKKRLEGKAKEIIDVHEENIKTSKQIVDILHERLASDVSPNEKLQSLWTFRQTPDMPVADFISLARKKAVAAAKAHECTKDKIDEAAEEWLLSSLCNNILPQYRREILRRKPKTSKEFEEIALIEESAWKATGGINLSDNVACHAIADTSSDKLLKLLEAMDNKMQQLTLKVDKLENEKKTVSEKADMNSIICFSCGRRGHIARECSENNQFPHYFNTRGRGRAGTSNGFRGTQHYRGNNVRNYPNYQGNNFRGAHQYQAHNRTNFNNRGNPNFRGNNRGRDRESNNRNLNS